MSHEGDYGAQKYQAALDADKVNKEALELEDGCHIGNKVIYMLRSTYMIVQLIVKLCPTERIRARSGRRTRSAGLRQLKGMGQKRFVLSPDDDNELRSQCE